MTQDELAAAAGMPVVSLRRYLNAQRHIDVAVLSAICAAMELDPQWVVAQAEERRRKSRADVSFADPAAGSGGFLVEAQERFGKELPAEEIVAADVDADSPARNKAARKTTRRGSTAQPEN